MAKVLVVDDSRTMRLIMRKLLGELGHEVVAEAANGQEAIAAYETHTPDLVTMDITMPVMDGITAVRMIVKRHPDAKIIMVSAYGHAKMVMQAMSMGAKHFLIKPITAERASKVIAEVLSGTDSSGADIDTLRSASFAVEEQDDNFVIRVQADLDLPGVTAFQRALEDLNVLESPRIVLQFPDKVNYPGTIIDRIHATLKKLQRSGANVSIQTADTALKTRLQV